MKTLRTITMLTMCLFLFSATSCVVVPRKQDSGYHKGWYKNSNNPHHYKSTNPGNSGKKAKKNKNKVADHINSLPVYRGFV